MTISVLLLTTDIEYCHRLTAYLSQYHTDIKMTVINSVGEISGGALQHIGVTLIGEEFADNAFNVPSNTACAYLVPFETGKEINGKKTFCKYRSGEVIYKIILSLFAEVSASPVSNSVGAVYSFVSSSGGAGATTAAAALCYKLAYEGKNVLYLDLDKFSRKNELFEDNADIGNLSDLIFAIKSNHKNEVNLAAKAGSLIKKDISGVKFINGCKLPCDLDELSFEELTALYNTLAASDSYDAVIIDGNIYDVNVWKLIYDKSLKIFIITENRNASAEKLSGLLEYIKVHDMRNSENVKEKTEIVSNKNPDYGSNSLSYVNPQIHITSSIPLYKDNKPRNIANAVAKLNWWELALKR